MSYLTNNWMYKKRIWRKLPRFTKAPASPRKMCDENERSKEEKWHACKNVIDGRKRLIRCICFKWSMGQWFLTRWRYYLFSNGVSRSQGDSFWAWVDECAIKLTMADTYDWWCQFPPILLGCWFFRICWVLDN